jgi:programmed cell death 6-interacting protein
MHEISKLKANDTAVYQEGVELLKSEAAEDERAKMKHGIDRWSRQPSQQAAEKLYAQVAEIDGYLKSASSSDDLVKGKLKECENVLTVLSGSDRDLEDYVPSSRRAAMPPNLERAAHNLRNELNEVSRLESRRRRQIEKVREKAKKDDISKNYICPYAFRVLIENTDHVILVETARLERDFPMQKIEPAQFENLFEERLKRYNEDKKMISTESDEQSQLTSQLKEANAAFTAARRGDSSTREREQALQRLENAYVKYKEIVNNLNTGRKFYNDLAKIVGRFRDECRNFAYQRRAEAGQLESDLANAMSALNISHTTSLQDQKQREGLRSHYSARAPDAEPLPAPVPARAPVQPPLPPAPLASMWKPELGIKFGGVPAPQQQQQQAANGVVHNPAYPNTRTRGGQWDVNQGVRFG